MTDFLNKLSTYNIFNYLLPGVVFVVLNEYVTSITLLQKDIVTGVFFYYFIGLIISRVGSVIIEPFLKKVEFVKFAEYKDYISAEKNNEFIKVLSEVNNMYRTLASTLLCLFGFKLYVLVSEEISFFHKNGIYIIIICLFVLFLFAYRKQTSYITGRVAKHKEEQGKNG
ncbi:hypothetical protein [Aeromonas enteropelogenes]|uniref:hypothetical protein n=1 Tax=Aeromonas enteropelogenes TaxID=29489 RepID=UPI003B9E4DE7